MNAAIILKKKITSLIANDCSPKLSSTARKFIPLRKETTTFKIFAPIAANMLLVVVGTVIMLAKAPENIINRLAISVKMIEIIGLSVRDDINIPIAISAPPKSIMPNKAYT